MWHHVVFLHVYTGVQEPAQPQHSSRLVSHFINFLHCFYSSSVRKGLVFSIFSNWELEEINPHDSLKFAHWIHFASKFCETVTSFQK